MSSDVSDVVSASDILQVGEFRVFQIAYARWFGGEPSESVVEPYFVSYMFNSRVPTWVRHFVRLVLDRDRQGCLDPAEFGIEGAKRPLDPETVRACNDIIWAVTALVFYGAWIFLLK